jgi:hypothetical protein
MRPHASVWVCACVCLCLCSHLHVHQPGGGDGGAKWALARAQSNPAPFMHVLTTMLTYTAKVRDRVGHVCMRDGSVGVPALTGGGPGRGQPTVAHCFLRVLADHGLLLRVYTQNVRAGPPPRRRPRPPRLFMRSHMRCCRAQVDGLERTAGLDPSLLVEAHGSIATAHCANPVGHVVKVAGTPLHEHSPFVCVKTQDCRRPYDAAMFLGGSEGTERERQREA